MTGGDPATLTVQSGQLLLAHAETMLWLMLALTWVKSMGWKARRTSKASRR